MFDRVAIVAGFVALGLRVFAPPLDAVATASDFTAIRTGVPRVVVAIVAGLGTLDFAVAAFAGDVSDDHLLAAGEGENDETEQTVGKTHVGLHGHVIASKYNRG